MLYIVPTRGRPGNALDLVKAWFDTDTQAQLLLVMDDDDPELDNYHYVLGGIHDPRVLVTNGQRLRLGGTLNRYVQLDWVRTHDIIGFMGDDHRPRTPHWDLRIQEAMRDMGGTGVIYGNDLLQGENLATAVAISSDIIREMGYMVPPGAVHLYLDNFWMHIGLGMGRLKYLPQVVIEHVHPVAGKAEWDDRYREVNAGSMYQEDFEVFEKWKADHSEDVLTRLKALL